MAKISRQVGSTSQIVEIFVQNSSLTTGGGLTGLTNSTSGLTCYYKRNTGSASVAVTLDAVVTLGTYEPSNAAHGALLVVDATNMPGMYELHLPNNALSSGADVVTFYLQGAANMAPLLLEIELTANNNQNAVNGGLTSLPNTACTTNGSLITQGTSTAQISTDGVGNVPMAMGQALPSTPAANTVGEAFYCADLGRGRINTAQGGTSTTITLDSGASSSVGSYVGDGIQLYSGTGGGLPGSGQYRTIVAYNTSTKVATVNRAWDITPDNTTKFITLPQSQANVGLWAGTVLPSQATAGIPDVNIKNINNNTTTAILIALIYAGFETGTAQAGGANTITLRAGANSNNNYFKNQVIYIFAGTGSGQTNNISSYVGGTVIATVETAWIIQPDNTSQYVILGRIG